MMCLLYLTKNVNRVNRMSMSSQLMSVSLVLIEISVSSPLLMSAFLPVSIFVCFFPLVTFLISSVAVNVRERGKYTV